MGVELAVRRWTQGRQNRLYVNAADGAQVGWRDLRTGEDHVTFAGLQTQMPVLRWLARALEVRGRDLPWRLGAVGEAAVGRRLDRLACRGAWVLHSIDPGCGGDIDHLVINRYGAPSLNTKYQRRAIVTVTTSAVRVQRRIRAYPQAVRAEAHRVSTALSAGVGRPVHVAPLVVVHGHARIDGIGQGCTRPISLSRRHPGGVRDDRWRFPIGGAFDPTGDSRKTRDLSHPSNPTLAKYLAGLRDSNLVPMPGGAPICFSALLRPRILGVNSRDHPDRKIYLGPDLCLPTALHPLLLRIGSPARANAGTRGCDARHGYHHQRSAGADLAERWRAITRPLVR